MNLKKFLLFSLILLIVIVLIIYIIFQKNMSKTLKNGNNMSNQEIENYILNITSYKTIVTVEIKSNKNSNKYILKQEYISPNLNKQEVIEPVNIAGVRIIRNENGITLENSRLELSSFFEGFKYLEDNCLDLSSFINDYSNSNKTEIEENEEIIVMKIALHNENKYKKYKKLYIKKETGKPIKMEIKDNNQKTTINILYNEIEINCFDN